MDTARIYHDSEGNERTIGQMIKLEPYWAANRLQEGEDAIERLKQLREEEAHSSVSSSAGLEGLLVKWQEGIEDWKGTRDIEDDPIKVMSYDAGVRIMRVMLRELKEVIEKAA